MDGVGLEMTKRIEVTEGSEGEPKKRAAHREPTVSELVKMGLPQNVPAPFITPHAVERMHQGRPQPRLMDLENGRVYVGEYDAAAELNLSVARVRRRIALGLLLPMQDPLQIIADTEARWERSFAAAERAGLSVRLWRFWDRRGIKFEELSARELKKVVATILKRDAKKRKARRARS